MKVDAYGFANHNYEDLEGVYDGDKRCSGINRKR